MFAVQLEVSDIRPSPVDVEEPPPIRKLGQERPWVLVQAMVEVVT